MWDHSELLRIKSLNALKMEKNFRAQDKGYVRSPADDFSDSELFSWVERELVELIESLCSGNTGHIREEIADVSNCLDYLYERVLRNEILEIERLYRTGTPPPNRGE